MSSALRPSPPRALRGYAPLAALLVAFAAITAFVPTTGREVIRTDTDAQPSSPGVTAPGVTPDGTALGVTPGSQDGIQVVASNAEACPDRAAQVPGDPYSPPCGRFTADNGGATAKGVTGDAVVVTWRLTDDTALAGAIATSAGIRADITDTPQDVRRTIEGLTDYFNQNFEFYGRRIDMRVYEGRGKFQDEILGAGQDAAAADAVTVADEVGAFAEAIGNTSPYADALARRGVLAIGLEYYSEEWYADRHPFVWGVNSCSQSAHQLAEYANQRLFGFPARWAGGGLGGGPRRVALVAPENPHYQECAETIVADLAARGNELAANLTYRLDINTASQDTSAVVARLADEQVTTVLMLTDSVSPLFFTEKAAQQRYEPEWIISGVALIDADGIGQLYDQDQWSRAFGLRVLSDQAPLESRLAYRAFKSVRPDEEPAVTAIDGIYENLYQLAIGIQLAGPALTPESFAVGYQSYAGGTGLSGTWRGERGSHTLLRDAQEVWWDPTAISPFNNQPGRYVATTPRYQLGQWPAGPAQVFP